jgi:hypothetical protein
MRAEVGTSAWPTSVEIGELDGDDDVELVGATNLGEGLFVAELVPGIGLEPELEIREQPAGGGSFDVGIADLDGDGDNDVTVTNKFADSVTLFRNDGTGNLVEAVTFETGGGPTPVLIDDLDEDGNLDLVIVNGFSNDVMLHLSGS